MNLYFSFNLVFQLFFLVDSNSLRYGNCNPKPKGYALVCKWVYTIRFRHYTSDSLLSFFCRKNNSIVKREIKCSSKKNLFKIFLKFFFINKNNFISNWQFVDKAVVLAKMWTGPRRDQNVNLADWILYCHHLFWLLFGPKQGHIHEPYYSTIVPHRPWLRAKIKEKRKKEEERPRLHQNRIFRRHKMKVNRHFITIHSPY